MLLSDAGRLLLGVVCALRFLVPRRGEMISALEMAGFGVQRLTTGVLQPHGASMNEDEPVRAARNQSGRTEQRA
jgi:hypothetical protein